MHVPIHIIMKKNLQELYEKMHEVWKKHEVFRYSFLPKNTMQNVTVSLNAELTKQKVWQF